MTGLPVTKVSLLTSITRVHYTGKDSSYDDDDVCGWGLGMEPRVHVGSTPSTTEQHPQPTMMISLVTRSNVKIAICLSHKKHKGRLWTSSDEMTPHFL